MHFVSGEDALFRYQWAGRAARIVRVEADRSVRPDDGIEQCQQTTHGKAVHHVWAQTSLAITSAVGH